MGHSGKARQSDVALRKMFEELVNHAIADESILPPRIEELGDTPEALGVKRQELTVLGKESFIKSARILTKKTRSRTR